MRGIPPRIASIGVCLSRLNSGSSQFSVFPRSSPVAPAQTYQRAHAPRSPINLAIFHLRTIAIGGAGASAGSAFREYKIPPGLSFIALQPGYEPFESAAGLGEQVLPYFAQIVKNRILCHRTVLQGTPPACK